MLSDTNKTMLLFKNEMKGKLENIVKRNNN